MIELYCETLTARLQLLAASRSCPLELKEAVCSIIYSAPHLHIEELVKLRKLFISRYGKKFPQDCINNCCISKKLIARLQHTPPEEALINYYLSAIAKKHNVDWAAPQMARTQMQADPTGNQPTSSQAQMQRGMYQQQPQIGQMFPDTPQNSNFTAGTSQMVYTNQQSPQQPTTLFPQTPQQPLQPVHFPQPGQSNLVSRPSALPRTVESGFNASPIDDLEARLRALSPGGKEEEEDELDEVDKLWEKGFEDAAAVKASSAACESALVALGAVVADLDSSSLFAASGMLVADENFSDSERALREAVRNMDSAFKKLIDAAKTSDHDGLAELAIHIKNCSEQISKSAVAVASSVPDPLAQQEIITRAKESIVTGQKLLAEAKAAISKGSDRKSMDVVINAANLLSESLKNLVESCKKIEGEIGKRNQYLDAASQAIVNNTRAFITDDNYPKKEGVKAEHMMECARNIANINAGLVGATTPMDLMKAAKQAVDNVKAMLVAAKGAIHQTRDPQTKSELTRAAATLAKGIAALIVSIKDNSSHDISSNSQDVAASVNALSNVARVFSMKVGEEQELERLQQQQKEASLNIDQVAQQELQLAAQAIIDACRRLETIHPPPQTGADALIVEGISSAILDSAKAIAGAAGKLMVSAAQAQAQRVQNMASDEGHLYHQDPTWANGLISAAKEVVGTIQYLIDTADKSVKGEVEEELLIASAQAVASATARLVAASRAKCSNINSSVQLELERAAKGIAQATSMLVAAAKQASDRRYYAQTKQQTMRRGLTQQQIKEIEAQQEIIKMENQLERARKRLHDIHKTKYNN
eukprot:CAMPEP_0174251466 /NCGR_PEP_ID=MMETSP0439-20130205/1277_1 /TAXON_ID=0 /ORGANISM="Stereomyxa ramosa, Strain Chinc5" /LENGTH=819 /DNA_ID=CAMNT_0015331791 /DNA_START=220 /DNA_END=2679 /DNA_ORIENTATION=+